MQPSYQNKGRKVRIVENSVERTARMLAQEHNIKVVWKPDTIATDGPKRTIYLPTLPPNAPDNLLEAIQGFLDHEAAHILFTDFAEEKKHPGLDKQQFACVNIVEDLRIEDKMQDLYPGAAYNLHNAHDWALEQTEAKWDKMPAFEKAIKAFFDKMKYGESKFWEKTVDKETKDLVTKCEAVAKNFPLTSTKDSFELGAKLHEILKEEAEEQKQQEQEEEKQQQGGMQGQRGKPSQQLGQPSDAESLTIGDAEDQSDIAEQILQQTAKAMQEHADKARKGGMGYEHGYANDGTYVVYSTQGDTYEKMPEGNLSRNGARLKQLRDEAREITGVIRTRLVNTLRAKARRRWLGGKEEGKLDTKKLHRAILGAVNVYKVQTDKIALDTAVVLAIDHSGSMAGRKLELAGETAVVLGDVLNVLKIPFMVYGYSTDNSRDIPRDTTPYARWGHLWIRHYVEFGELWEKGATRLAGSMNNVRNNTLDAESVKYGVRRLMQRKEKRKILLVLNDGMPYPGFGHLGRCQQHLHDVVASAGALGVEVVAFGIHAPDVKEYYPNHIIINNLEDMVKEPLVVLDGILRKGMKAQ